MNKHTNTLNVIKQEIKDVSFGFCRKNIDCNIPIVILNLILIYYYDNYKFNIHKHGDNIIFAENRKIAIKNSDNRYSTCIFGEEINDKQCNIFNIYIKWKRCIGNFYMGYLTDSIQTSIKNWNIPIGRDSNKQHSVAIGIFWCRWRDNFCLYDKDNIQKELSSYSSPDPFKENDIFVMSFNFKDNIFIIHHNGNKAVTLSLNGCKAIIPAFSISLQGEEIEIIKCEMF